MRPFADWSRDRVSFADSSAFETLGDEENDTAAGEWLDIVERLSACCALSAVGAALQKVQICQDKQLQIQEAELRAVFAAQIENIEKDIVRRVTGALLPVLDAAIRDQAVTEFVSAVKLHVAREKQSFLSIRAPAHLHHALQRRMAAQGLAADLVESRGENITAVVGASSLEADLDRWRQKLTELEAA